MELTLAQVNFFRFSGYLRLNTVFSEEEATEMARVVRRHIDGQVAPFRSTASGKVFRVDGIVDRDPIFLRIIRRECLLGPLRSLLGPNVDLLRYRHNHATVNDRGDIAFRLHRDIQHWTRGAITAILYLEDSTPQNGCTHVVPGTQFLPFAGEQTANGGGNWADEHAEYHHCLNQAVPVPVQRGGVLLFDSLMFHSVGANLTDSSRMSITLGFHSTDDLSDAEQPKRLLVCGNRPYKGNDGASHSAMTMMA